jgi:uncharacterized RDD family membrane protein YckC
MIARDFECPACGSAFIEEWSLHGSTLESKLGYWIILLNPFTVINQILLGQCFPERMYVCKACPVKLEQRSFVRCDDCSSVHSAGTWRRLGNWLGLMCPSCGSNIRCLWGIFSVVVLAVTAPAWWLPVQLTKKHWHEREYRRLAHADHVKNAFPDLRSPRKNRFAYLKAGVIFAIWMDVWISLFFSGFGHFRMQSFPMIFLFNLVFCAPAGVFFGLNMRSKFEEKGAAILSGQHKAMSLGARSNEVQPIAARSSLLARYDDSPVLLSATASASKMAASDQPAIIAKTSSSARLTVPCVIDRSSSESLSVIDSTHETGAGTLLPLTNRKMTSFLEKQLQDTSKRVDLNVDSYAPAGIVSPVIIKNELVDVSKPRPWLRYWARMFDAALYGYVIALIIGVTFFTVKQFGMFQGPTGEYIGEAIFVPLLSIPAMILWWFIEAFNISTFGATLGKWIFGVRVRELNGEKLSYSRALGRAFQVWLRGLFLMMPCATHLAQINAFIKLQSSGVTSWDSRGAFRVEHRPVSITRIIVAFLIVIPITVGYWLLSLPSSSYSHH